MCYYVILADLERTCDHNPLLQEFPSMAFEALQNSAFASSLIQMTKNWKNHL